jgi:adenylyl-sulfate kinase
MAADNPLRSANVVWQPGELTREQRWQALGGPGGTVWFTGLPSSGKSTVAAAVEARLIAEGRAAYVLDGDNLRHGLNGDLGFSVEDRAENVRRTAEVAALMADAGVVALVSLVRADRAAARAAHERRGLTFVEAWVSTPLEECERRDPKGLYARARAGEIPDFTGIGQPYEEPEAPELEIAVGESLAAAVERVLEALRVSAARSA